MKLTIDYILSEEFAQKYERPCEEAIDWLKTKTCESLMQNKIISTHALTQN